jgi:phosphoribosylglycinamide formyltransferase 1
MNKKLLIFASGSKDGGGSGFEKLCENKLAGVLQADIVAVVSNHANGGVKARADKFSIPFIHFEKPWTAERYQQLVQETGADFVALSGWLKLVAGLNPRTTINIHPGPLPRFGGPGLYGHFVHEAVMEAFRKGEITHSAVTKHFVTENYDEGPEFFRYEVKIFPDDTAETLAARVNKIEHEWQSIITNKVIHGEIAWDGINPDSLIGKEVHCDIP